MPEQVPPLGMWDAKGGGAEASRDTTKIQGGRSRAIKKKRGDQAIAQIRPGAPSKKGGVLGSADEKEGTVPSRDHHP